jgi:hypothetical protein
MKLYVIYMLSVCNSWFVCFLESTSIPILPAVDPEDSRGPAAAAAAGSILPV